MDMKKKRGHKSIEDMLIEYGYNPDDVKHMSVDEQWKILDYVAYTSRPVNTLNTNQKKQIETIKQLCDTLLSDMKSVSFDLNDSNFNFNKHTTISMIKNKLHSMRKTLKQIETMLD